MTESEITWTLRGTMLAAKGIHEPHVNASESHCMSVIPRPLVDLQRMEYARYGVGPEKTPVRVMSCVLVWGSK